MHPRSHADDPTQLAVDDLAARCGQQTGAYFRQVASDPRYCYELFRRALGEAVQAAWEAVYVQYAALVGKWVREHPAFFVTGEEADAFVNCAFAAFWKSLSSADRLGHFTELDALLAYLKACARSCVRDKYRQQHRHVHLDLVALVELSDETRMTPQAGTGGEPMRHLEAEEWQLQVQAALADQLQDPREQAVYLALFEWDLKPREVCALHPELFDDVHAVYRVKRNLMDRLSRDVRFRELAGMR